MHYDTETFVFIQLFHNVDAKNFHTFSVQIGSFSCWCFLAPAFENAFYPLSNVFRIVKNGSVYNFIWQPFDDVSNLR